MKTYSVTATFSFSLEAPNEEKAQERAEKVLDSFVPTKAPTKLPPWWPDLDVPEIEVTEEE